MSSAQPVESEVLDDLAALRAATRSDVRPTSVPLLVFGALLLISAALPDAGFDLWWSAYWVVAGPLAFALIAWRYRKTEADVGVGDLSRQYSVGAIGTAVLIAMVFSVFLLIVSPLAGAGVSLVVVSRVVRDRWVMAAGFALFLLGLLEPWFILSNRVFEVAELFGDFDGSETVFRYSRTIVVAVIAAGLLGAGAVARRQGR